jgi:hypothetical protein
LRSRIGRVATAVAFALVICSFGVGPARAADAHRGGGGNRAAGHGGDRGGYRGGGYAPTVVDNYYAPAPDYYVAPEPYYYGDGPEYVAPPPQGISLFFGL